MYRILLPFFLCGALVFAPLVASAITIDWVTVGDPGNAANPLDGDILTPGVQSFGAVDHSYMIGKYDVTWNQYVAFLNSNDPTGDNLLGLYFDGFSSVVYNGGINYDPNAINGAKYSAMDGRGNRPANAVDFYQAARFANWLNNNQAPGSTETGAYTLLGGSDNPTNGETFTRNADAKVFLPSEDEWYKAAFYNPVTKAYYLYPTSSNTVPTGSSPTATPNSANFYPNGPYALTDVGGYSGTTSPYGAFDMGGNVQQWNDTIINVNNVNRRGVRGASFINTFEFMRSSTRGAMYPYNNIYGFGFRMAAVVPEPSSGVMALIAIGMLWLVRGRIKKSGP
jgi:formylglycine-generating enzyme required for sulfatase activity